MNMVRYPKHVPKTLAVRARAHPCAVGRGHAGDIPTSILLLACVDAVHRRASQLTGKPAYIVGMGAMHDGRGLAATHVERGGVVANQVAGGSQELQKAQRFQKPAKLGYIESRDALRRAAFEVVVP
ncbi:hypothetical protein B0H14DRAFT_3526071 [Mycena olivaceomarginata]|nr:hypothetical protein B0H14DRAFT_3526071 [Mycena olivaceomarginata]